MNTVSPFAVLFFFWASEGLSAETSRFSLFPWSESSVEKHGKETLSSSKRVKQHKYKTALLLSKCMYLVHPSEGTAQDVLLCSKVTKC